MGNGPGGLKEYIELYRSEPLLQGGLVWEWSNHGLLKKEGDLEYYAYGGDFGDEPNDADFIMDGLTLSDHSPMPSLNEYAKVIQPISVNLTEDGSQMVVTNWYDFVEVGELAATWHIVQDGKKTESKDLSLPRIAAGESQAVDLPVDPNTFDNEAWITIEFSLKNDTLWADKGHVVAWDQLYINGPAQTNKRATSLSRRETGISFEQERTHLKGQVGDSAFDFDLLQGNLTWTVNGLDLFKRGPELYFYRAQTQNDEASNGDGPIWEDAKLGMMYTQIRDVTWKQTNNNSLEVHYKVWVGAKATEWGVQADLIYTILPGGSDLRVQARGDFVGDSTPEVVPRIGLMTVLPEEFDSVTWFGRGPGENYKDTKQGARVGEYEASVSELFTHYDYPQENGNREDLRWLKIGNGDVTLSARMEGVPFSFTAQRYMPFDLDAAKHPFDLKPLNMTVLHLDYDNNGIGSATVGPRPFEQYRCYTESFDFTFELSVA